MLSGSGYRRLDEDSSHNTNANDNNNNEGFVVELGSLTRQGYAPLAQEMDSSAHTHAHTQTHTPSAAVPVSAAEGEFTVRVLCRERTHTVRGLSPQSSVHELKERLVSLVDLPPERQRLVLAGKLLRPEDKTLAFFKVTAQSVVHLFPMPVTASVAAPVPVLTATATPVSSAGVSNNPLQPLARADYSQFAIGDDAALDPFIQQTGKEVRMWCMILMFLSAFTLFNNLSYFGSTGRFGKNALDSVVFVMDTCCSAGGIWVASMGMKSLRSLDLADMRRYVHYLGLLALSCIVMRICWVFDIMLAVQKAVHDQRSKTSTEEGDSGNDSNTDAQQRELEKNAVQSFTIQAGFIAMIIIYAWVSCYLRARRLHQAVESYQRTHNGALPQLDVV